MPEKRQPTRKVYIATQKDAQTREEVFKVLGGHFDLIDAGRIEEAEFVVLDCDDPAEFREWVSKKLNFLILESSYPPIVLAALGGQGDHGFRDQLAKIYDGDASILPLCDDAEDLVRTLRRLQAALPFYNSRNAPAPDPAKVREMAISVLRTATPQTGS